MVKHQEVHPTYVEGCFGCRIASVRIGAAAMPTRHERTNTLDAAWAKQMRDDEAYKTLRRQGLQPARTAGCHELAQVNDARFIEGMPELWSDRAEHLVSMDETPQVKVEQ
jgi:hypothetical protein